MQLTFGLQTESVKFVHDLSRSFIPQLSVLSSDFVRHYNISARFRTFTINVHNETVHSADDLVVP